jgi:branched-chain amino acid transport system substrate-binding protein
VLAYDGLMFYAEAVKAAKSTKADDVLKAVASVKYEGLRGSMAVRGLDGQMAAPSFIGPVAKDSAYPYLTMKGATRVDASKTLVSEDVVKAARAAAK